jgi:hypothetical protein
MIRQYIAFAVVVLIAIFVVTQFEWSSLPVLGINQIDSGLRIETVEQSAISDRVLFFGFLCVGGVPGAPRLKNPENIYPPPETVTQTTVAMSSPLTATSTPFQTGQ